MQCIMSRIPVTVATGFLGAGKTTLINHILTAQHGKKLAVIENEFGEIGIDKLLVNQKIGASEEIFELNNGCVCCKVRGDLIRILTKLVRRKSKLDGVLIETTGLADPAPVAQTFFTDEYLREHLELDAILTVVDAKLCLLHLEQRHEHAGVSEAVQQVAFADKILLNKVDLVTNAERERVKGRLKSINRQAEVIECSLTKEMPNVSRLLGLGAFNLDRILTLHSDFLMEDSGNEEAHHTYGGHAPDESHGAHGAHTHDGAHAHDCARDHPGESCSHEISTRHESGVTSVSLRAKGSLNPQALNEWLGQLLRSRGPDLFRSKGILCLHGQDCKTVFQGVHNMWQFGPSQQSQTEGGWLNQMVFIGRELDKAELSDAFTACLLPEETL